jgi:carboxymethylenebutenolidase
MCFDLDSHPPIPPLAGAAIDGRRIQLQAADGTDFAAYEARPTAPAGAGMIILPDVRGLYRFYEELALRFAEAGIAALAIDYFGRTAGTGARGEDFDYRNHVDQTQWPSLQLDIKAARDQMAGWGEVRAVFSVGFCFGGRLSFLLASESELKMSGVVGFYGWPVGESRGVPAPIDRADDNLAPILGLFGGADQGVTPEIVEQYRAALDGAGADSEIVSYPGAPHSFFDRKAADFAEASADSWRRTLDFVSHHTPAA